MKVTFAPQFFDKNPYQTNLINALSGLGVLVNGITYGRVYLPRALNRPKPDILHLHWLHKYSHSTNQIKSFLRVFKFIFGLITLKFSHTKIVWTAHNLKDHESLFHISDKVCTLAVSTLADAIIVHSKSAKQVVEKNLLRKASQKVFVIPHGNYLNCYNNTVSRERARRTLGLPGSATIFLFFGLIRSYKGIPELIQAFKQLNNEEAYLVIAGNSKDKQLTNFIQSESKEDNHIRFYPGFIPDDDVQIYMNACNAVVLPYRNFLTSGSMLLAMSFGRTCVAPRIGCVPEILQDKTSFLYGATEEDGLWQAMNTVLSQKHRCDAMGKLNLARVQDWDWEKVANMTLDVYRSLS